MDQNISMSRNRLSTLLGLSAGLGLAVLGSAWPQTSLAETRWYAVGMNVLATHSDGNFGPESNCPKGGNGEWVNEQISILKWRYGYSDEEAKKVLLDQDNYQGGNGNKRNLINERAVKDGQPTSIYWYPTSIPLHPDEIVVPHGRGYGFDLDGKAATRPDSLMDPETHEYIENNLFRVLGCYGLYNINLPARPTDEESNYITGLAVVPPLLIGITGDDLSKDGPVTVTFGKPLQHASLGADGKPLRGQTYTLDPSVQNFGTLQGKMVNGELTAAGGQMSWIGETPLLTILDLTNTHIRLKPNADGSLGGYLGGFEPWMDYWYQEAVSESFFGVDISAMYYYCQQLADADPDPVTGKNRRISATYRLDDIMPVYVLPPPNDYRPPADLRSKNRQLIARYQGDWGSGNPTYAKLAAAGEKR